MKAAISRHVWPTIKVTASRVSTCKGSWLLSTTIDQNKDSYPLLTCPSIGISEKVTSFQPYQLSEYIEACAFYPQRKISLFLLIYFSRIQSRVLCGCQLYIPLKVSRWSLVLVLVLDPFLRYLKSMLTWYPHPPSCNQDRDNAYRYREEQWRLEHDSR